jgi:hypothetical protein
VKPPTCFLAAAALFVLVARPAVADPCAGSEALRTLLGGAPFRSNLERIDHARALLEAAGDPCLEGLEAKQLIGEFRSLSRTFAALNLKAMTEVPDDQDYASSCSSGLAESLRSLRTDASDPAAWQDLEVFEMLCVPGVFREFLFEGTPQPSRYVAALRGSTWTLGSADSWQGRLLFVLASDPRHLPTLQVDKRDIVFRTDHYRRAMRQGPAFGTNPMLDKY